VKSILQTKQWADFKASQGFEILDVDDLFAHKRILPCGQNFLYLPEVSSKYLTAQNMDQIKKLAKEHDSIFARIEFVDKFSDNGDKIIRSFGFVKSFEQVQPKWRHVVNTSKSEDEILAQMKSKGRYNIRLAQRYGVKVEKLNIRGQIDKSEIEKFYDLVLQTVRREKISGRSLDYFIQMIDSFSKKDYLEIYIASYKSQPLAGALVSFYGDTASYLYGGSSSEYREVMAPYALHWQIIKDAKVHGMSSYDMLGRSRPNDSKSKWSGVTRFKEQFGGEAIEILGSYDFIAKPMLYRVFKLAERVRRRSE
jgi:lipid II:glycine glycyltransferase (peptidoglycan interpeptide bridge formation enzyme)